MLPEIQFSSLALADLKSISRYTVQTWGAEQAVRYMNEIEECIRQLADTPLIGRPCESIQQGGRCMEQGRHVIFYRHSAGRIRVTSILHQRMLPKNHRVE
ncbi:MAG TPA: type II toxin-antitoxin system RelE/ParE family toxin [Candidatus Sulfotelmatobacter sp.]|nr:type II toxin-antitoxin system RelE/ParE family toxin [Candidatus Sulfotelmatobacter sp.]